jgi:hypothetical protein
MRKTQISKRACPDENQESAMKFVSLILPLAGLKVEGIIPCPLGRDFVTVLALGFIPVILFSISEMN